MPKKKVTIPVEGAEEEVSASTAVAVIQPNFEEPATIQLLSLEESLKIIQKKADEYALLTIDGVEDTEGFKKVVSARGEIKKSRTAYVNAAYENVIDPVKKAVKQYEADIAKIETAFKAIEKPLQDKEDFIKAEKIRLAEEKEAALIRAMQVRVTDLTALGGVFDGMLYTFHFNDGLIITAVDVKNYSDEEYSAFLADVKASYDVEQQRLENERLQKIEDERVAQELADAVSAQAEANKTARDALATKQTKLRIKELTMLGGLPIDADGYSVDGHSFVSNDAISNYSDEEWEQLIESIENYVAPEPVEEPIAEVPVFTEDELKTALGFEAASGNPVEQPQESYVTNEGDWITPDLSLNEYEKFVEAFCKKPKIKADILLSIKEYRELMDKM